MKLICFNPIFKVTPIYSDNIHHALLISGLPWFWRSLLQDIDPCHWLPGEWPADEGCSQVTCSLCPGYNPIYGCLRVSLSWWGATVMTWSSVCSRASFTTQSRSSLCETPLANQRLSQHINRLVGEEVQPRISQVQSSFPYLTTYSSLLSIQKIHHQPYTMFFAVWKKEDENILCRY